MNVSEIQRRIVEHKGEIEELGVSSLELFGSAARGESTPSSDIDLLVEFSRPVGLFTIGRLQEFLEEVLSSDRVDLVLRRAVIDELKERIYAEAVPCLRETGRSESDT